MNDGNSPLHWSIPGGTLFSTRIRISVFFPLILVLLCFRLGLALGALFGLVFFASVLLHEFGHVFGARATGGSGDEILMTPLGGLALVQPAQRLGAQLWTTAAGPVVNLFLCVSTFWPTYVYYRPEFYPAKTAGLGPVLNPLVFPELNLTEGSLAITLCVMTLAANWVLLLINLVPVYPLDGGRMLQLVLNDRMGRSGTDVYLKIGFVVGLVGAFGGLMADSAPFVFIASMVLLLNMQESLRHQASEPYDESFMGYDFSQGYTSLEREDDEEDAPAPRPPRKGWLQRWRDERRAKREAREREQDAADAARLDELLEKVQLVGMEGLTEEERRFLTRTSQRMRERGRPSDG